jgi:hypothetical protein
MTAGFLPMKALAGSDKIDRVTGQACPVQQ